MRYFYVSYSYLNHKKERVFGSVLFYNKQYPRYTSIILSIVDCYFVEIYEVVILNINELNSLDFIGFGLDAKPLIVTK